MTRIDPREERYSRKAPENDQRNQFQIDRDRILYSTAFRRLAGVTQVVSPVEGDVFHSRLTHTVKVAQVARRLAEMFLQRDKDSRTTLCEDWGGINPDVVESAGLAHDLGHPPFGHIGEKELNKLVIESIVNEKNVVASEQMTTDQVAQLRKETEGYEGNAQSFRIVTRLLPRRKGVMGLDLTRATLNATLKYPWIGKEGKKKYSAYAEESKYIEWARECPGTVAGVPCIEAQIMDWADDITYSVHDVEDFYRAGRIPLDRLRKDGSFLGDFCDWAIAEHKRKNDPFPVDTDQVRGVFQNFFKNFVPVEEPFGGTRDQRQMLYTFSSDSIGEFIKTTQLIPVNSSGYGLKKDENVETVVMLLKDLIWKYAILNPSLAAHQHGQRQAVRNIFNVLDEAAKKREWHIFPATSRDAAEDVGKQYPLDPKDHKKEVIIPAEARARLVADTVASLTDQQALRLHQRLTGSSQGSVMDPIVS